jgi:NAD(P)-dependent dehydrogenase (short-subunit alcohol dehydrogenase family)
MSKPLSERVAIVTGASSGLGARFSTVLAQAGAHVVACARRDDRLQALAGHHDRILPMKCDVTDGGDRQSLVTTVIERFGRIDVCVNNAGIASGGAKRQATLEAFTSVMRVNVESLFAMSELVGQRMISQKRGSIINVSSILGFVASLPYPDAGYVASKSAVNGLTRELAVQWARHGVRVNAIAPGWFQSEMNADLLNHESSRKFIEENCPMGRVGQLEDFDGALLFLASDASSYCTGQVITIDGGWTAR